MACSSRSSATITPQLATTAQKIVDQMNQDPQFGRVVLNYNTTTPQLTLSVDRDKAAALGIDINGLGPTLQAMIDGTRSARSSSATGLSGA